jgi:hypothetical protein
MSSSQRQFDFFGFLGKYVNFQEFEETKFFTTSDPEFLQILFHFKWTQTRVSVRTNKIIFTKHNQIIYNTSQWYNNYILPGASWATEF